MGRASSWDPPFGKLTSFNFLIVDGRFGDFWPFKDSWWSLLLCRSLGSPEGQTEDATLTSFLNADSDLPKWPTALSNTANCTDSNPLWAEAYIDFIITFISGQGQRSNRRSHCPDWICHNKLLLNRKIRAYRQKWRQEVINLICSSYKLKISNTQYWQAHDVDSSPMPWNLHSKLTWMKFSLHDSIICRQNFPAFWLVNHITSIQSTILLFLHWWGLMLLCWQSVTFGGFHIGDSPTQQWQKSTNNLAAVALAKAWFGQNENRGCTTVFLWIRHGRFPFYRRGKNHASAVSPMKTVRFICISLLIRVIAYSETGFISCSIKSWLRFHS